MRIAKYLISPGRFDHSIPKGSKVIDARVIDNEPQMWVTINEEPESRDDMETRNFITLQLGHNRIDDDTLEYISSYQDGDLVHLFEDVSHKRVETNL